MCACAARRKNTSLRGLDISDVNAGIKGLISVCSALGSEGAEDANCTLQALDVGAPIIHMQQVRTGLRAPPCSPPGAPPPSHSHRGGVQAVEGALTLVSCSLLTGRRTR